MAADGLVLRTALSCHRLLFTTQKGSMEIMTVGETNTVSCAKKALSHFNLVKVSGKVIVFGVGN